MEKLPQPVPRREHMDGLTKLPLLLPSLGHRSSQQVQMRQAEPLQKLMTCSTRHFLQVPHLQYRVQARYACIGQPGRCDGARLTGSGSEIASGTSNFNSKCTGIRSRMHLDTKHLMRAKSEPDEMTSAAPSATGPYTRRCSQHLSNSCSRLLGNRAQASAPGQYG